MGKSWGRLYINTRNHRKVGLVRRRFPKIWTYLYPLMELAFEIDDEGQIYITPDEPYSWDELKKEIHFHGRSQELQSLISYAIHVDLFAKNEQKNEIFKWLNYNKRQFKSDDDVNERVRKYREKNRLSNPGNGNETLHGNVSEALHGNAPETETETETEKTNPSVISTSVDMTPPHGEGSSPPGDDGKKPEKPEEPKEPKGKKRKADRKLPPYSLEFEAFWKAYPNKKGGKEEAWAIWNRRLKAGTLPPLNYLLECIHKLSQDQEWMEYAPMVTTFLNKGRWSDVEGLKKSPLAAPPTHQEADPNCPKCNGEGFIPVEKDGKQYKTICPCRKITHGTS